MADLVNLSHFLHIPFEIRLMIYDLLLDDNGDKTLSIRSEPVSAYKSRGKHERTGYRVLGGVLLRQSQQTTYHLVTDATLCTSILGVNRRIYEETSQILYGRHRFDFGRDIEAVVPFLSDLTPQTRPLIRDISLTKKGYVYTRDFDRCEWRNVCDFLSQSMHLRKLILRVAGGQSSSGWDGIQRYTASDFKTLASFRFEGVEWIQELVTIQTLKELEVIPEIEHCHPPKSSAMLFFQSFSASINNGLTEYLQSEMLST